MGGGDGWWGGGGGGESGEWTISRIYIYIYDKAKRARLGRKTREETRKGESNDGPGDFRHAGTITHPRGLPSRVRRRVKTKTKTNWLALVSRRQQNDARDERRRGCRHKNCSTQSSRVGKQFST